jgi:allantoate deiminase
VQLLRERGVKLPFNLEVVGFSDEEGVRYQTTYLGSRALAGTLTAADLARIREKQIIKARRPRGEFLGYSEVHIEQGPVLEEKKLSVGIVTAIAGQSRFRIRFFGMAGHAGTVPMDLRRDALCAAAEFILEVEKMGRDTEGLVATVGQINVLPGAGNVIPGEVSLTLDVRHVDDIKRTAACAKLRNFAKDSIDRRIVDAKWESVQQTSAVVCDKHLTTILEASVRRFQSEAPMLPSGAGHDAAALSAICPVAMLFVRCKGGISHNPAESVKTTDVASAIGVLADFIQTLATRHA